jgi:16S rRNA (adenine1518-N6/adenine1519-N6)-dimethyltransferase
MAIKSKKYLGQNFLRNHNIARKMTEAADIGKNDIVLEVGPGRGILTNILIQKARRVIAIEKDKELADFLMDKLKDNKNLKIVHYDILKFNPKKFSLKSYKYKIVANIPYYITSRFLRRFLTSNYQPSLMALMVQKEVAERIMARDNKETLLSISVKAYGRPKIIVKVSAKNFSPAPKVDSAVILIDKISKDFFKKSGIEEKHFFGLLRLGFGHKRKLLKNNLKISPEILQKCEIPALSRAEELSLNDWKCLVRHS